MEPETLSRSDPESELDPGWLKSWIQPQHLKPRVLAAYREELESRPTRHLVIREFLKPSRLERVDGLLSSEARFETSYGLYSRYGYVSEEEWKAAEEADRFYRYGRFSGVREGFELSHNLVDFLKLRVALVDARFRDYLAAATGLALSSGTTPHAHAYGTNDFLKRHDDDARERLLTLVLYLSKGWQPEFGGALYLVDPEGHDVKIEAEYNSLVLFDVTAKTEHDIAPVTAADKLRTSIGCWYHKPTA